MRCVGPDDGGPHTPLVLQPLHVVTTSKQRLIYDARYINLWMVPPPFSLDALSQIPGLAALMPELTAAGALDHASGDHHVLLAPEAQQFFGFEFDGLLYVFTVLPFGWNVAPFIYQAFSAAVASFLRLRCGIHMLAYLDDLFIMLPGITAQSSALMYCAVSVMLRLGYTLQLKKCSLFPVEVLPYLGFEVNMAAGTFRVLPAKLQRIHALLDGILSAGAVSGPLLESLVGKCAALRPALPPALMFLRCCYALLARMRLPRSSAARFAPGAQALSADVLFELRFWRMTVTSSSAVRRWRRQHHLAARVISSDSSSRRWGGVIDRAPLAPGQPPLPPLLCADLWAPEAARLHINVKEFLALLWVLYLGVQEAGLADCVVDAYIDSSVLLGLLKGDWRGSPSPALNLCLLFLWFLQCSFGFELRPHWIPSEENQAADELSRLPDTYEYMISRRLWRLVQQAFGPHALDLMSSAALTHSAGDGRRLPFVSRFASPEAVSYDVFRASLSPGVAYYAHPPPPLIMPLLAHLRERRASCTVVVPRHEEEPWWAFLIERFECVRLAQVGEVDALSRPSLHSSSGFADTGPLTCELWAFAVRFSP